MADRDAGDDRIEILSADELRKTVTRLASQVLESVPNVESLVLLDIVRRYLHGALEHVRQVACCLESQSRVTVPNTGYHMVYTVTVYLNNM